jgi:hypothetical protein
MASNSNSIIDFMWMSSGGLLLDSSGDLAFTNNSNQSLIDMTITRLQADLDAWKMYPGLGADLDALIGETESAELEITIQKQLNQSLANNFLPKGSFTVETISIANIINIYVYIQGTLVASTSLNVS